MVERFTFLILVSMMITHACVCVLFAYNVHHFYIRSKKERPFSMNEES